jgi:hypothetical protein
MTDEPFLTGAERAERDEMHARYVLDKTAKGIGFQEWLIKLIKKLELVKGA